MPPGSPNGEPERDQAVEPVWRGPKAGQFLVDRQRTILAWDPGMERLTGLAADQAVGSRLSSATGGQERPWLADLLLGNDLEAAREIFGPERVLLLPWGGEWLAQGYLAGRGGQPLPVLEIACRQASPDVVSETVYLREEAVVSSLADPDLETLRILAEHVPAGVALMQDGRLAMVNQSFCAMFGYSQPDELVNLRQDSLLVDQDKIRQRQVLDNLNHYEPGQADRKSVV